MADKTPKELAIALQEAIVDACLNLMRRSFAPVVIIGENQAGDLIATGIQGLSQGDVKTIVARVMVGEIDPTLLERRSAT
jgi:hypothetical protein